MSTPAPPLESWRSIIQSLFPWLKMVRVATDKGLSLKTASGPLHLQGDVGDPAAITTQDTGGRYLFDPGIPGTVPPALYWSAPDGSDYVPVKQVTPGSTAGGSVPTLSSSLVGTTVRLGPGSVKVTVAS